MRCVLLQFLSLHVVHIMQPSWGSSFRDPGLCAEARMLARVVYMLRMDDISPPIHRLRDTVALRHNNGIAWKSAPLIHHSRLCWNTVTLLASTKWMASYVLKVLAFCISSLYCPLVLSQMYEQPTETSNITFCLLFCFSLNCLFLWQKIYNTVIARPSRKALVHTLYLHYGRTSKDKMDLFL